MNVSGLLRGGSFHVFTPGGEKSEREFLRGLEVGAAFVISSETAKATERASERFRTAARELGITLRWDEAEVLRTRERVVLTGIAPNTLTRLLTKHRQHGLVRARVTVVDPETGKVVGTKPEPRGVRRTKTVGTKTVGGR